MPEGFATEDEGLCSLLCLMDLVPGSLGVLHLGQLHVLTDPVKLLLGVLEFTHIPGGREERRGQRDSLQPTHVHGHHKSL